jgi:AraC-like DNA-binding protein
MHLAAKALRRSLETVAAIAFDLGYESESAFGNAFKRVMGQPPRRYQRENQSAGSH